MAAPLTRVDGPPNDPAERVPCSVIEPVVEAVEALLGQELGRSEVEVRIKLVNDTLKPQHSEQPGGEGWGRRENCCQLALHLACTPLILRAIWTRHVQPYPPSEATYRGSRP